MRKLQLIENKVLKLNNVLSREILFDGQFDQSKMVHTIVSWIENTGNKQVGPLISYSSRLIGMKDNGTPIIKTKVMVQLRDKILHSEPPYDFSEEICIENCIFVRFQDKAENLPYSYSKINLLAYENDIRLKGDSYTIFVSGKDTEHIVADVFMPVNDERRI